MASPGTFPRTYTQTSHALTIHASNGDIIGAINQWQPEQTLATTAVYEFGNVTGPYAGGLGAGTNGFLPYGAPYEHVPGNITGMTMRVQRYDVYTKAMEEAFGTADLQMLTNDPGMASGGVGLFDVREQWQAPANISGSKPYSIIYYGCWFTNIGRTHATSGDRITNVNASLVYTRKARIL